jgi:hypothetical protein
VAVDSGTLWTRDNTYREKVVLRERIDRFLVDSLLRTAKELKKEELEDETIHALLMRSILIMYLEDRGAASETNLYSEILPGAKSYLDILNSKTATYLLFKKVEEHFNGNVFPLAKGEERQVKVDHLRIIRKCLIDGDLSNNPKLFENWRVFRFDLIQIELLSEIYEHFLEEFKEKKKAESGQYYTPPSLVELILNDKLNVDSSKDWNYKVLDPACGSGIFLVESFKRLVQRWKNAHPGVEIKFSDLREIMLGNIFGIEYDRLAIRVTAFSLYLAMLDFLNPKSLWIDRRYKFPYLIYDKDDKRIERQGQNLVRQDTIGEVPANYFTNLSLVVGNPPFGDDITLGSIKTYIASHQFGADMVIPFLHKAVDFAENAEIALIFNTKLLTNSNASFQRFRDWLFNETYVEKIYNFSIFRKAPKNFGGQLFSSAVGPVSILYYQKKASKPKPYIEYWAPKTYVKSYLVEGIIIDATDIKYLPRADCSEKNTSIWKVAMWGTMEDYELLKRLRTATTLEAFLDKKGMVHSTGVQFMDGTTKKPKENAKIGKLPYANAEVIQRYNTPAPELRNLKSDITEKSQAVYKKFYGLNPNETLKTIKHFRRMPENDEIFEGPHVLVKKGLSDKRFCASYFEQSCSFNSKVIGIGQGQPEVLKALTALLNSSYATYFLFMMSSSLGIEREEIQKQEIMSLPVPENEVFFGDLADSVTKIIARANENYPMLNDTSDFEAVIDELILRAFGLSAYDRVLIEDFLKVNLSLLFDGHRSRALLPGQMEETIAYADMACHVINEFLEGSGTYCNAVVYDFAATDPLNMIHFYFSERLVRPKSLSSQKYNEHMKMLNRYSCSKLSQNIYVQKQLRYYDGSDIYLVKPNQRRFWIRSQAISDARSFILEILQMSE